MTDANPSRLLSELRAYAEHNERMGMASAGANRDRYYDTARMLAAAAQALTSLTAENERLRKIETTARALVAVRAEYVGVSDFMPDHPGNSHWMPKFMAGYGPLESALGVEIASNFPSTNAAGSGRS